MFSYHLLNKLLTKEGDSPDGVFSFAVSSAVRGLLPHDSYVELARKTEGRRLSPSALGARTRLLLRADCNPLLDLVLSCESEQGFATQWNAINSELPLGVVTQIGNASDRTDRQCRAGHDSALRENIVRTLIEQLRTLRGGPVFESRRALSRVTRDIGRSGDLVVELVDFLFEDPFADLRECVAELGSSQRTLQRQVGQAGVTFLDLRRAVRLNISKDLLRDTADSVTNVAVASGFYDAPHFCHAFREACGTCPTRYRALLAASAARSGAALGA